MSRTENDPVSVALLYETRERGEHLREILDAFGAPVVYEALASAFDRNALERSRANVVVVNLDAQNDPGLDGVYDLLDDARYRVVFNESEVSAGLSGTDRARWARHLAAKVLGTDVDPPRPADAQAIPAPPLSSPSASAPDHDIDADADANRFSEMDLERAEANDERVDASAFGAEFAASAQPRPESIDLSEFDELIDLPASAPPASTELAAPDILPSHEPLSVEENFSLVFEGDAEAEMEGIRMPETAPAERGEESASGETSDQEAAPAPTDFDLDFDLDLDLDSDAQAQIPVALGIEGSDESALDNSPSADWSLEDVFGSTQPPPQAPAGRADFGIETLRPEEFLAPEGGAATAQEYSSASAGAELELIPLEEAVSPTRPASVDHENWLDPDAIVIAKTKVHKVWVLGASIGGPEAVREFLSAIPRDYPALFLLAQHLGEEFVGMMVNQLKQTSKLTVRTPMHGERVAHGDVVVVPIAHRLLVDAEGVVVLERTTASGAFSPSIDDVLRDVADRFGANAGAIIFSGMSSDAAEGSRYLAERGGEVYAQRPETCVVSSMIDGVRETGVVTFLGSPRELAEKLLEVKT